MIREITSADKALFLELAKEFYSSDAVSHRLPEECHERCFNEAVASKLYLRIFIFEYEGKPAGYSTLSKQFSTEAGGFCMWIEDLYVRPEFRSKGLASEYFAFLSERFGYAKRFRLEAMHNNTRALSLYKRMGFEQMPYLQLVKER